MSGSPPSPTSPTYGPPVEYGPLPDKPRTGMAIGALVCGIVGLVLTPICAPVGLVGLILGIIATARASRDPQQYGGKGLAIGGICTGGASLVILPVVAVLISILLPSLARAREIAKRAVDASNLHAISQAALIYARDHGDQLPPDLQALLTDGSITAQQLIDPSSDHAPPYCDYYYVSGLAARVPADWIMAYSDPTYHNGEGANIVYVDGRVSFEKEPRFTQEIDRFKADFEKKRGQPPVIIPPR